MLPPLLLRCDKLSRAPLLGYAAPLLRFVAMIAIVSSRTT